jgi:hypothetical protein
MRIHDGLARVRPTNRNALSAIPSPLQISGMRGPCRAANQPDGPIGLGFAWLALLGQRLGLAHPDDPTHAVPAAMSAHGFRRGELHRSPSSDSGLVPDQRKPIEPRDA